MSYETAMRQADEWARRFANDVVRQAAVTAMPHKLFRVGDLERSARALASAYEAEYDDAFYKEFTFRILGEACRALEGAGYRNVSCVSAMDGGLLLGYVIECDEAFSYMEYHQDY